MYIKEIGHDKVIKYGWFCHSLDELKLQRINYIQNFPYLINLGGLFYIVNYNGSLFDGYCNTNFISIEIRLRK